MLTTEQALELSKGIGASECGAILGVNPYQTPYELWLIKTGRATNDISNEEAVIMGNLLEPVIAKRYAQLTGNKVARVNRALYHPDRPHMLCHLDRKVIGQRKCVEIKTANPFSSAWGEAGTDEIPPQYIAQVQHQLAVTGFEEADLIVFRGTTDLRIYNFKPDLELIEHMLNKIDHFWNYHIKQDVAPEASNRADLKLMFPSNNGQLIAPTDDVRLTISELKVVKETLAPLEKQKLQLEKNIIQFIADNDGIGDDAEVIATFKANKHGTRSLRIK